ncbi:MAG TPA: glycosyltransferase family 1 protein [Thermoanaerobaculia bacterium]|jgi:glycosyltransferase involved in cell wall biosynthesis|nr:glycosyltransferase family 1 protein [Thermoanaerobaculia bacterium]
MRVGIDARKIADFGIGTYIRGLLHALVAEGGEDTYVALAPERLAHLLPAEVEHVPVNAPHYSLHELIVVGHAAEGAGIDLFHAPHYVVPFMRMPFVVTVHDLIHLHHANPLARLYARQMIGRAVRNSRRVFTVSEAVKRDIVATFGCRGDHVVVTPNGVGAPFSASGHAAEGRYFLYVGNDKPHKNVDVLVEACTSLADATLVLTGAPFERFLARDGVVVTGFVDDGELAALYRGAIALVMPSREEGFGLPALEAMACGGVVITSNDPALVEITGDAALHVNLNGAADAGALRDAMRRLASDEALRQTLAWRGVERARTFTWKRCADLTRGVYRASIGR